MTPAIPRRRELSARDFTWSLYASRSEGRGWWLRLRVRVHGAEEQHLDVPLHELPARLEELAAEVGIAPDAKGPR